MNTGVIQIPAKDRVDRGDVVVLNCVFGWNLLNF